jgi:hypothetical protein
MVHTCPRCELRFTTSAELANHLDTDHHADVSMFERYRYKPRDVRPSGRRYLVVANETLNDDIVFQRIQKLAADHGAHFHLVVPATHSEGSMTATDDKGLALATYRLRHMVDRLHDDGIDAEGEVGDPDPAKAVARALAADPADEIIVSAKAPGVSRWLAVDVPKQLEHTFHLPVTVVTAPSTASA